MSLYEVGEFSRLQSSCYESSLELCCSRDVVCFLDGCRVHVMREKDDNLSSSTLIEFDNKVVTAGISEDGSFLVVGDSDGVLHYISVTLELIFHSQKLLETLSDYQFTMISFSAIKQGCCRLLVLSSSGLLTVFSNFLINKLASGVVSGDMLCVKEVQSVMSIEQVDLKLLHSDTVSGVIPCCEDVFVSFGLGFGSSVLSVWYLDDNKEMIAIDRKIEGVSITKCAITKDDGMLVTLTNSADLLIWLLEVLVIVNHLSGKNVSQFELLACSNGQQDLLACVICSSQNQKLQLLTLPKLSVVYSVSVNDQIILSNGFIHEDTIYFGISEKNAVPCNGSFHGDVDIPKTKNISIKMLIQTQPEDKLTKLLSQHSFVEAFTFATKYGLDLELVHKKKAEVLNDLLCHEATDTEQYQLELTNTLTEIMDEQFICSLILKSSYLSDTITRDMLLYAKNKIENTQDFRLKICDTLNRLVTYQIIHKDQYSPVTWRAFMEGNLLMEFMSYIQEGVISFASRIWERHEVELASKIDEDTFVTILQAVPEYVSSNDMATWLMNDILPCVLCRYPNTLNQFTIWISDWIKRLELTEKIKWPLNALNLLDIVLSCLTSNRKWDEQLGIQTEQCMSELKIIISPCITTLQDLRQQLHNLNYIKRQLGLIIPFFEYLKETHETVVFKLLDRTIAAETIPSIVQTKILPYLHHFSLSLDSILVHYITHMITRVSSLTPDSPWEAKGVAVVQAIGDRKLYVEGCIELLRGVRTYWSTLVEGLVQDCFLVNHSCVKELRKEYELLKLKRMLFEYGITDFNYSYSNLSIAWRYIHYVLKQTGNTILKDALKIAELYSLNRNRVYMLHVANLGLNDKLWDIHNVLSVLETEDAKAVSMRTVGFMIAKIDNEFNQEMDCVEEWRANILIGIECLKYLQHLGINVINEEEITSELLSVMKRLLTIQDNYNIFLTCHTLRDPLVCDKLINHRLSSLFSTSVVSFLEKGHQFIKLGTILGYSNVDLHLKIANECIQQSKVDLAMEFICLIDPDLLLSDSEQRLYVDGLVNIVIRIWVMFEKKGEDIERTDINWIVSLSATIVQKCTEDWLLYAVELHSLCCLIKCVWSQCIGDFDSEERFSSVIEINRYKEDGLILELSRVFSVALNYCHMRLGHMTKHTFRSLGSCDRHETRQSRVVGPACIDDDEYHDIVQSLINLLEENGHYQLAISIGIQSMMASDFIHYLTQSCDSKTTPTFILNLDVMKNLRDTIMTKVLTSRTLDHSYGLALLLSAPVSESRDKITECRHSVLSSYTKVKMFCKLTADYGITTGLVETVKESRRYYITADWGKRLRKYQVSFTKAFRGGESEKKAVLLKMFESPSISFDEIVEFCSHFGFDNEEVYLVYIRIIITVWSSGYEDRIADVIKLINNWKKFAMILSNVLTKGVSPYDYEKIGFLLNLLKTKCNKETLSLDVERGLKLLECVKRLTRQAPLSIVENNWIKKWKSCTKDHVKISNEQREMRLPFNPLLFDDSSVAVTILSTELTRESLSKIVPICSTLQISPDTVLENAIINVIRDRSKDAETIMKYSDVALLVVCIECNSKAISMAKWVAAEIKKTDMKESIEALEGAVGIAEKWKKSCTEQEADVCYRICKRHLQIAKTELMLHNYGIKGEEFTTLSSQPDQLIMKLYHDLTIARPPVMCVHDIATKIGEVCNLNVQKIRMQLAEEWLPFSKLMNRDMDITQLSMMEDPTAIDRPYNENEEEEEEREEDISLRRLSYLLNLSSEVLENSQYLINWAQTPKIVGGAHSRVRALQVLFAISPIEIIESVSYAKITNIRNFIQNVLFVCELDDIHMKTTIEKFEKCKKEGLIKTLWRNHSNEPKAVRLICELCIYYNIHDYMLWNKLLEQLLQLHMVPYLHYILRTLSWLPIIHKIPGIQQLWYNTLVSPLKEVSVPPTSYQIRECSKSVKLLKQCPFLYDINITQLADLFQAIGMSEQRMACLELLPP